MSGVRLAVRERELLRWVATGVTAGGIAQRLGINEHAAKSRVKAEDRAWLRSRFGLGAP